MAGAPLRIEVVCARPGRAWRLTLALPAGATVADALAAADLPTKVPGLVVQEDCLAIHGRTAAPGDALRDGDRVEVLRPLLVDPMQARRRRARDA
ncbi:RnfH family protein [Arenimonas donghaensis]|uniref:UPF0125 protein N788_02280 n=1 Tax=Arenimonas donghaensis DSM 18148 = HO3-R19 TaxID=1121014 RepID=A0A087MMC0_9GAMM|nr:RnfH family protein [Arenimonas donghaensis]KFL38023.1 hypothetical protein N788_02280 [Arenimonas donghaensis DSM 18148 = HO3-R19]